MKGPPKPIRILLRFGKPGRAIAMKMMKKKMQKRGQGGPAGPPQ